MKDKYCIHGNLISSIIEGNFENTTKKDHTFGCKECGPSITVKSGGSIKMTGKSKIKINTDGIDIEI